MSEATLRPADVIQALARVRATMCDLSRVAWEVSDETVRLIEGLEVWHERLATRLRSPHPFYPKRPRRSRS